MNKRRVALASLLSAQLFSAVGFAQLPAAAVIDEVREQTVRPGINRDYLDPDLDVSQWIGRFELESREVYAARQEVVAACQIRPAARVADIGAGTGIYTRLFSAAAGPEGWVFAVDISPPFLKHVNARAAEEGLTNITAVLCSERSINLPPESIDLAFVCDTYHHFEFPQSTLASIHRALRDEGQLIVVDFERVPGQSRAWVIDHVRAGKEVVRSEIDAAGFELIAEPTIQSFRENYLLRFKKRSRNLKLRGADGR